MHSIPRKTPRGFTLTELLVVIGIIAVLAALVTPAVMNARKAARVAAVKVEIDMLHMAVMNYRNEYGSFPPCFAVPVVSGTDAASRHLQRIFPRLALGTNAQYAATQPQMLSYLNNGTSFRSLTIGIDNALVLWLYGYNADPSRPVLSTTGTAFLSGNIVTPTGVIAPRKKLFDFDASRVTSSTAASPCQYYLSGKPESPYLYIDSARYPTLFYSGSTSAQLAVAGAHLVPISPRPAKSANVPDAWFFTNTNFPSATTQAFFNPDSFQILSAGLDGVFGNDDDMSNFWKGTRKEYLDSLQQ